MNSGLGVDCGQGGVDGNQRGGAPVQVETRIVGWWVRHFGGYRSLELAQAADEGRAQLRRIVDLPSTSSTVRD